MRSIAAADIAGTPRRRSFLPVLLLVLVVGGWLRFTSLDWDGLKHTHPDESYINWVQTTIEWTGGPAIWLDPERSSLNPFFWPATRNTFGIQIPVGEPRRFAYGHFPLYLTVLVAKGMALLGTAVPGISVLLKTAGRIEYDYMTLVGRAIAAAADTTTMLFVYYLGRRMGGMVAGILAAAVAALAVQHIQQAHFGAFDAVVTACVAAGLLSLARYVAKVNAINSILAGGVIGLAVGSKISAVILLLPAVAAVGWACVGRHRGWHAARQAVGHGVLLACAAFVVFALTNPFSILEWRAFLEDIARQGAMVRGLVDWPFVTQYRNTVPYAYQIGQQGRWMLGWPLTLAAYAGAVWCLWEWMLSLRRREYGVRTGQYAVLFAWALPYFVITGAFVVKFPRYMLPVMPVLFVFAGVAMSAALQSWPRAGKVLIALVLLPTGAYALAFVHIYSVPHPWVIASNAIYADAPPNATILLEKWDHPLPLDIDSDGRRLSRKRYELRLFDPMAHPDDDRKLSELLSVVSTSDFIVISSNRNYGPIGRLTDVYPLTSAYYRALFDGALGYELVATASRFPEIAGVAIRSNPFLQADMPWPRDLEPIRPSDLRPGFADESFTVYDHPLVLVYRNTVGLSVAELQRRVLQQ